MICATTTTTMSATTTTLGGRVHACCVPDGSCQEMREARCQRLGGIWEPPGSDPFCTPRACGGTTTSTTTTSSITMFATTSTQTTTSTTDLGCFGTLSLLLYEVEFFVSNNETLGALQFDVDYSGILNGAFSGSGAGVACTRRGESNFAAFFDNDAENRLSVAMVSLFGFTGPIVVTECEFVDFGCSGPVTAERFTVTITDQSRPDLTPGAATVAVRVKKKWGASTSTTTTTLPQGLR